MSQENVEMVRRACETFGRRDLEAIDAFMREHVTPDAEFESALTGQVHRGAEGGQGPGGRSLGDAGLRPGDRRDHRLGRPGGGCTADLRTWQE